MLNLDAIDPSQLLTTDQAAKELTLFPGTLAMWRYHDKGRHPSTYRGPAYINIAGRIRYRQSDLQDWLRKQHRDYMPAELGEAQ